MDLNQWFQYRSYALILLLLTLKLEKSSSDSSFHGRIICYFPLLHFGHNLLQAKFSYEHQMINPPKLFHFNILVRLCCTKLIWFILRLCRLSRQMGQYSLWSISVSNMPHLSCVNSSRYQNATRIRCGIGLSISWFQK